MRWCAAISPARLSRHSTIAAREEAGFAAAYYEKLACADATLLTAALGAAAMSRMRHPHAETCTVRLVRPMDLSALPLLIMEHERLIERTAEAMGLGRVAVGWPLPKKPRRSKCLPPGRRISPLPS